MGLVNNIAVAVQNAIATVILHGSLGVHQTKGNMAYALKLAADILSARAVGGSTAGTGTMQFYNPEDDTTSLGSMVFTGTTPDRTRSRLSTW